MKKKQMGIKNFLYPNPVILVGVTVNGKPTYTTVSYCAIANRTPAMMMISLNKSHYITAGLKSADNFSINIPSTKLLQKVDYCGLVSGKNINKSVLFDTFYGVLKNVPMIAECPINMELETVHSLELEGSNQLIIGKVIESYSEESYLTNALPDLKKIDPILLSMYESNYYSIGEIIGKAWSSGQPIFESNPH